MGKITGGGKVKLKNAVQYLSFPNILITGSKLFTLNYDIINFVKCCAKMNLKYLYQHLNRKKINQIVNSLLHHNRKK